MMARGWDMGEADEPRVRARDDPALASVAAGRNPLYSTVQRSNGSVHIADVEDALDEIEETVTEAFATVRLRMKALAKPPISGS